MSINRVLKNSVIELLDKYPILAITGPRQSGKTTFLKTLFSTYRYVNLENPDVRKFAETDPNGFLNQYDTYVILDEVQRVPELFSYLQDRVDSSGLMGQYILSGSQNFHLMQSITQSLAGRVAIFRLFPFDHDELKSVDLLDVNQYLSNLIRGYYPALYDRDIPSKMFYSNYIQTYIQRDVTELVNIRDIRTFQNFLSLCATRAGQLLNLNALANECGITQPTAKSWLSALENSFLIFLLHPYHRNFSKRIVKTPKLYFYDTGLLCHLLKINSVEKLQTHSLKGSLFENQMIAEYTKQMHHRNDLQDIWFWRDSNGNEIDLLIQSTEHTSIVEFKASMTVVPDMFKGLNQFQEFSTWEDLQKIVVYTGKDQQVRKYGRVLPWGDFTLKNMEIEN